MDVISSWLFHEDKWSGEYAQVRGDSRTEAFRDVYRRCLLVFFSTARRTNPSAQLVLYLNRPWKHDASETGNLVKEMLEALEVEFRTIDYKHEPPASFTKKWKNQFFVLDILKDLSAQEQDSRAFVLLDSDVVWTSSVGAEIFWTKATESQCVLPVKEAANVETNGQSPSSLARLLDRDRPIDYFGGELVASPVSQLEELLRHAESAYESLMDSHRQDTGVSFEEAHVLSAAYQLVKHQRLSSSDAKRMWTQPLKYRNVESGDENTTLWHVPAEKKYGLRRLSNQLLASGQALLKNRSDEELQSLYSRYLGVPRNTAGKWCGDVSYAGISRVRAKLSRSSSPSS